jgi:plastocyanin
MTLSTKPALALALLVSACSSHADAIAPARTTTTASATTAVPAVAEADTAATPAATPAQGRLEIRVTEQGFEPDHLKVAKGTPVTLAFTRQTDHTCAKQVVLQLGGGKKIEKELPLGQTVLVEATFAEAGELRYACGMDMISGVLSVQ